MELTKDIIKLTYSMAIKWTRNYSMFDYQDLAHYAFIQLLKNKEVPLIFRTKAVYFAISGAWLRYFTNRTCCKHDIFVDKTTERFSSFENQNEGERFVGQANPYAQLEAEEEVRFFFAKLNPRQSLFVYEYFYITQNYAAIGRRHGLTTEGVRWIIKNALNK